jgi:hypothetical protein
LVLLAIKNDGSNLKFASEMLKQKKEFMIKAILIKYGSF